jgi:predicted phage terminase large subunit-like protein
MTTTTTHNLTVRIPRPHPAQREVIARAARYTVVACGRRWGKTKLAVALLINAALKRRAPAAYFAPSYKYLSDVWRELKRRLHPVIVASSAAEKRIELLGGGVIEMWSLDNPDAGRSRRYARVVIDEAALVGDLEYAWTASIRATLADLQGDAWFLSTPRGKQAFYDLFLRAQHDLLWAAVQQPTGANPHIRAEEIEAMRADMPAHIAAQELDAQFIDATGSLFRREHLRIVDAAPDGLRWSRGYDLAASTKTSADYSASVACAVGPDGTVYLRDGWRMRAEWPDVRRVMVETMRAERTTLHVVEQALHGLAATQELLRDPAVAGIAIRSQPVDRDKYTRALPLAARAEQGKLALVRGAWTQEWIDEALRFPAGAHDDYIDAATLAYAAAARHAGPLMLFEVG